PPACRQRLQPQLRRRPPTLRRRRPNPNNAMVILQRARRFFSRARFRFWTGCLLLLCGVILPSGCLRREPPANLTILNGAEPQSLDPALLTGQADMRVSLGLFEGLTRFEAKTSRA